jgi:chromosome segregation ATPase
MDPELKAILKEIVGKIDKVENKLGEVENKIDKVENRLGEVENKLDKVENRLGVVENKLVVITNQLDRMEAESNSDVIAILESMNGKLETLATKEDIDYLAGQLGKHDLEIDRLKRVK